MLAEVVEFSRRSMSPAPTPPPPAPANTIPPSSSGSGTNTNLKRVEALSKEIHDLLGGPGQHAYSEALLTMILAKGKATVDVQLGFPDQDAHIHRDLAVGYEDSGYVEEWCMHMDDAHTLFQSLYPPTHSLIHCPVQRVCLSSWLHNPLSTQPPTVTPPPLFLQIQVWLHGPGQVAQRLLPTGHCANQWVGDCRGGARGRQPC